MLQKKELPLEVLIEKSVDYGVENWKEYGVEKIDMILTWPIINQALNHGHNKDHSSSWAMKKQDHHMSQDSRFSTNYLGKPITKTIKIFDK